MQGETKMNAFHGDGRLNEAAFDAAARSAIREALTLAGDAEGKRGTRSSQCKPGHLLLALLSTHVRKSEECVGLLGAALRPPARVRDLEMRIGAYVGELDAEWTEFSLARSSFDWQAQSALEGAARQAGERGEGLGEASPSQGASADALLVSVLRNPGPDENEHLPSVLDAKRAIEVFSRRLAAPTEPEQKLYLQSGELNPERFTEVAFEALDEARKRAAGMGYERVQSPHLFLALLAVGEGPADRLIRQQCDVGVSPATVSECLVTMLTFGPAGRPAELRLDRDHLAKSLLDVLAQAEQQADLYRLPAITQAVLLLALLKREDGGPIGRSLAEALPGLNRERLLGDLEDLTRRAEDGDDSGPLPARRDRRAGAGPDLSGAP